MTVFTRDRSGVVLSCLVAAMSLMSACAGDDPDATAPVRAVPTGAAELAARSGVGDAGAAESGSVFAEQGVVVGWLPDRFELTESAGGVQDLDPDGEGASRYLSSTWEVPAPTGTPLDQRPDVTVIVSEDAALPLFGAKLHAPAGDGFEASTVQLDSGAPAVVSFNSRYRYGSVDWMAADHVKVVITGGPLDADELLRIADSLRFDHFVPCVERSGAWDIRREHCQPRNA